MAALGATLTDDLGEFELRLPDRDSVLVSVRALGYRPTRVRVSPRGPTMVLSLERSVVTLAERRISAERTRVMGLDARALSAWVIDEGQVNELRGVSQSPGDLIRWRAMPGVTVSTSGECVRVRMGPCALVVIDDVPLGDMKIVQVESVRSIVILRAIEATNLFGSRASGGAVVIQTR